MKNYLYIFLVISFFACKDKEEIPNEIRGQEYAGISVGAFRVYEVTEIQILPSSYEIVGDSDVVYYCDNSVCKLDTETYYIKEVVDRLITDNAGDEAFVIHYFEKNDMNWDKTPDSVWTAKFKNNQFLRTENNYTYSKLVFPISSESRWDYNVYNINKEDETRYSDIRIEYTINGEVFENVVVVEKEFSGTNDTIVKNNETLDLKIEREYYAPDIGLIFREESSYANCQKNGAVCSHDFFIVSEGKSKLRKLIDHN